MTGGSNDGNTLSLASIATACPNPKCPHRQTDSEHAECDEEWKMA